MVSLKTHIWVKWLKKATMLNYSNQIVCQKNELKKYSIIVWLSMSWSLALRGSGKIKN